MTQIFSCINPDLQEKHAKRLKKVVLQLRSRTTKSAGMDQKKHQLWTVRLNEKLRLFFTEHAQVSGATPDVFLLHIMENHKYKLALPVAEKLRDFVIGKNQDLSQFTLYQVDEEDIVANNEDDAEANIDIIPQAAHLFRDSLFQLSREQDDIIRSHGSFMVYGAAGTGKSSSALFLIEQLLEQRSAMAWSEPPKPILFLAQSPELVKQIKRDWALFGLGEVPVIFMTTQEFYAAHFKKDINFVGYEDFQSFYKANVKSTESHSKKNSKQQTMAGSMTPVLDVFERLLSACKIPVDVKKQDKSAFLCRALYQELCLLAPWGKYDDNGVTHVGERNSYFSITEFAEIKPCIVNLLKEYRAKLVSEKKFDLAVSVFSGVIQPLYSHLVMDEGQNFPLNELAYVAQFADERCIFMDDNQNTQAPKSSILLKQQLLKEIAKKDIPIHRLAQSFRCSTSVNQVANEALRLRDDLAGISPEESVLDQEQARGEVKLYVIGEESETTSVIADIHTKLIAYKKTEIVIITSLDHALVQTLFPGYIIYHPEDVAGLEFQCAVLYHPLGKSRQNNPYVNLNQSLQDFSQASIQKTAKATVPHSLKHATTLDDPQYTQLLQTLYMTCTRASNALIVAQKKFDGNEALLERWTASFVMPQKSIEEADEPVEEATEEEWKIRLIEMMSRATRDEKNIQHLVEAYLYPTIAKSYRWPFFLREPALAVKTQDSQKITTATSANNSLVPSSALLRLPIHIDSVSSLDVVVDHLITLKSHESTKYKKARESFLQAIKKLRPASEFSLFYELAFPENQAIYLKLMNAEIFTDESDVPLDVLMHGWEMGEVKEQSAFWQLLQTEDGCAILHKLISLFYIDIFYLYKAIPFLLETNSQGERFLSSLVRRTFHEKRFGIVQSFTRLSYGTYNNFMYWSFLNYLLEYMIDSVNAFHFPEADIEMKEDHTNTSIKPLCNILTALPDVQAETVALYQKHKKAVQPKKELSDSEDPQDPKVELIKEIREKIYSVTLLIAKKFFTHNVTHKRASYISTFQANTYKLAMQVFEETRIDNARDLQAVFDFFKNIHDEYLMKPLVIDNDRDEPEPLYFAEIYKNFIFIFHRVDSRHIECYEMVIDGYNFFEQNCSSGYLSQSDISKFDRHALYHIVWSVLVQDLRRLYFKTLPEIRMHFERVFAFFDAHMQDNKFHSNNRGIFLIFIAFFTISVNLVQREESSDRREGLLGVIDWKKLLSMLMIDKPLHASNINLDLKENWVKSTHSLLEHLRSKLIKLNSFNELDQMLDIALKIFLFRKRASIWITSNEQSFVVDTFPGIKFLVQRFISSLILDENTEQIKKNLSTKLELLCAYFKSIGRFEPDISDVSLSNHPSAMFSSTAESAVSSSKVASPK